MGRGGMGYVQQRITHYLIVNARTACGGSSSFNGNSSLALAACIMAVAEDAPEMP